MGRYLTQTVDKAEQFEEWIQNFANEFNKNLIGAELQPDQFNEERAVFIATGEPVEIGEQTYFNGFISMNINFDTTEPDFLTVDDRRLWYQKVMELAGEKFGLGIGARLKSDSWPILVSDLYYFSINFKEDSEDKLYVLTPNKEDVIRKGFKRLQNYIDFYTSAVKDYMRLVQIHNDRMQEYLKHLETFHEQSID